MQKKATLVAKLGPVGETVTLFDYNSCTSIIRKAFERKGGSSSAKITQIANTAHVPPITIRNLLTGVKTVYMKEEIVRICDYFNLDVDKFIYGKTLERVESDIPESEAISVVSESYTRNDVIVRRIVNLENGILRNIKGSDFNYSMFHRIIGTTTSTERDKAFESGNAEEYAYILFAAITTCNGFIELNDLIAIIKDAINLE